MINDDRQNRQSSAFYLVSRMVSIKLKDSDELVKGRVYLYDDITKTLILKIWDEDLHECTGMGIYNSNNIVLDKIHVLSDLQTEEEMAIEYSCTEDSYNKIVMDRKAKFCKEQVEARKLLLDQKYGARKQGILTQKK